MCWLVIVSLTHEFSFNFSLLLLEVPHQDSQFGIRQVCKAHKDEQDAQMSFWMFFIFCALSVWFVLDEESLEDQIQT